MDPDAIGQKPVTKGGATEQEIYVILKAKDEARLAMQRLTAGAEALQRRAAELGDLKQSPPTENRHQRRSGKHRGP